MPGHKIFGDSLALSDECFLIAFVIFLRLLLWGSSLVYFSERKKEVWIHRYGVNGIALKKAESGHHRMVRIAGHLCVSSFGPSLLHFCQLESYQRGHFEKSWSYRQNHGSGLLARLGFQDPGKSNEYPVKKTIFLTRGFVGDMAWALSHRHSLSP